MWEVKPRCCNLQSYYIEVMLLMLRTGVPASELMWSKWNDATRFPSGSMLQLVRVGLSHIGVYLCTPVNEVGSGPSANLSLNVIGELFSS